MGMRALDKAILVVFHVGGGLEVLEGLLPLL